MPAWSVPGSHSVLRPRIRALRVITSCSVTNIACPMCSAPVTFGGGIGITNGGPVAVSSFGAKYPRDSHHSYRFSSTFWCSKFFGRSPCRFPGLGIVFIVAHDGYDVVARVRTAIRAPHVRADDIVDAFLSVNGVASASFLFDAVLASARPYARGHARVCLASVTRASVRRPLAMTTRTRAGVCGARLRFSERSARVG